MLKKVKREVFDFLWKHHRDFQFAPGPRDRWHEHDNKLRRVMFLTFSLLYFKNDDW
jgi:hypothetical protein